ncbi:MAG: LysR family transcriptional regulator [Chloroflexi bacterium]|jgi:DNA-binding transcriptional LysR family regulator|nr:LysR family transcriptional regulator [Chloroflexota bacterium]MBT3670680.1 LysR family transcriptional regulator [Chloroflexota bacterium]MBT4002661.1 LysR family transcriptional regulator [Chloroflexota bacterium]MBT4306284.1 LysR family transcriptional regulator [Chloroflexota bacterium]MBT4532835.1 LysR family transcriptional regulator [Chloroflexota bacterium]
MLNVHQLNVFATAAETLNFTQTAKRLHLTQSSVSQHIKALENQLGVDLFVRKGRTLEITDAGNVLVPMAKEVVEGSIRASEQMELLKQEIHGHLIVGCNTAPGKYVLPRLLAEFHKEYPLVRISCQVLPQLQTLEGLAEGEIHFAFTNVDDLNQSSADFKLYMQEPLILIVPLGHPWATRDEIEPEELYDERYIMRDMTSGTYINTKSTLRDIGIEMEKLDVLMEMGTSESVALAVEQGLGVGFVSKMIVDKICDGKVKSVRVRGMDIVQNIYFGRQVNQPASGAQAAFWGFINGMNLDIFESKIKIQNDEILFVP